MRIFTAIRHSLDPAQYYGSLWSDNFHPALRRAGHQVIESAIDLLPASRFMEVAGEFTPAEQALRRGLTERILEEVKAALSAGPVDLFLSYFYNSHFDPAGFDELRALGIPSVNFYCNSIHQFDLVRDIAASVDHSWHPERDAAPRYVEAGARPVWVQMGADPDLCAPVTGVPRLPRACFVGQRYADRDRLAAALLREHVPVDLYGSGWGGEEPAGAAQAAAGEYLGRRTAPPATAASYSRVVMAEVQKSGLAGVGRLARRWRYRSQTRQLSAIVAPGARGRASSLPETFARYEVVLNFSNVWADSPASELIPHVRLRDFEGPMTRSCYLTGHSAEIAECYEVGSEIDTYRTEEELIDKTRYYLSNPAAAESLRAAGYERARRDHTWSRRFDELFRRIDLHP